MSPHEQDRAKYLKLYNEAEVNSSLEHLPDHDDRYQDLELIGEGGMKVVHQAYDSVIDRFVAFAELKNSDSLIKQEAFLREAQLTAQLEHPNIISIFDISPSHHRKPWFTMELKTGKDYSESLLANTSLQLRLERFLKVCDAIDYAHSRGIVHLDLKPDNIQIGSHGEVLVCDWGLGQMLSIEDQDELIEAESEQLELFKDVTITGKIKGTPGYMAPEQITAKHPKSFQTDIYSLGALLYATLCTKPPFEGDTKTILDHTTKGELILPKERFPDLLIPESLNAVIKKAMALSPHDRYQSVQELQNEVRQYLSGFSTNAEQANLFKELLFFYNRHKFICNVTFISLLIISTIISVYQSHLNNTLSELKHANTIVHSQFAELQSEKQRSEQALTMAVQNKKWLNELVMDNEDELTTSTYIYCAKDIYHTPIQAMNMAVHELKLLKDANPEHQFYTTQLGYIYSLMQKFEESDLAYSQVPSYKQRSTTQAIKKLAQENHTSRPLPVKRLIQYLKEMVNPHNPLYAVRMLYYDAAIRNNPTEHASFVMAVLNIWNPNWSAENFYYDSTNQTLHLKGSGLNQLTYHHKADSKNRNWDLVVNLIGSLPIQSLKLSESDYYDLASLKELPYKSLDISNTSIIKLHDIQNFKHLQNLTIHKKQFSKKELKKIPASINLIIKD